MSHTWEGLGLSPQGLIFKPRDYFSIGIYSVFRFPGRPCCDCGQQSTGPLRVRQLRTGRAAIFWSRIAVLTQHFLSQWEQIPHISSKDMCILLLTIRTRNTPRRHVTCRSAQCVSSGHPHRSITSLSLTCIVDLRVTFQFPRVRHVQILLQV